MLKNGESLKQFKLTLISDRPPTEDEFYLMKRDNPNMNFSQEYVKLKFKELTDSQKFLYDKEELQRMLK